MKRILIGLVVVAIAGFIAYNYVMAPPKKIANTKSDIEINAILLAEEFTTNETDATKKYDEKVIEVQGKITAVDGKSVTLDNKINCIFKENVSLKKDDTVKIKGLFIGYDEMFGEVKLDQSTIIKGIKPQGKP